MSETYDLAGARRIFYSRLRNVPVIQTHPDLFPIWANNKRPGPVGASATTGAKPQIWGRCLQPGPDTMSRRFVHLGFSVLTQLVEFHP